MTNQISDSQLVDLYRGILVPWETSFASFEENWHLETFNENSSAAAIVIKRVERAQFLEELQLQIDSVTRNFFVFVRSKNSKGRDLYRHIRNAIAHAGTTRHDEPTNKQAFIRFKTPSADKKLIALAGQIEETRLPVLLSALNEMAQEARRQSEA